MKRKTKAIVGVVLAAALLATFVMIREGPSLEKQSSVTKMFGGEDGLLTVTHPTKVKAYRLKSDPENLSPDLKDYDVSVGPVSVPDAVAAKVSAVLVSRRSYGWDYAKGCLPRYGVRLSFLRGSDQVDVYLCLECRILGVTRNGTGTGGEDFDPMNAVLVSAVKSLFPDDSEIQKLKEG